jgi:hypothetical protein
MRNINQFQNTQFDPYSGAGAQMAQQGAYGLRASGNQAGRYAQNMFGNSAGYGGRAQQGFHQLRQYAMGENPMLNNQIQQYGQDIGQNLNQNIMPGINAGFQNAGQRGSSRQGIAQGLAAQGAMEEFGRGATELRSNAYNQGLGASQAMTQFGLQGQQGMAGLGMQGLGQQGAAYQGMGQFADTMSNIGQFGYNAQFQPFQVGAEVIGDPTTLSRSRSKAWTRSGTDQFNRSSGSEFGLGF